MNEEFLNGLMDDIEAGLDASEQLQRYTNYGKLEVGVEYLKWENKKPTVVDSATYKSLPASSKQMNIIIGVDIQEFKADLDFGYSRKVKFCGKDWYDILEPSIVEVFGLEGKGRELTTAAAKALFTASGKYVFVDDTPNKAGRTYNDKVLKVPALTNIFESREAMVKEVENRFGGLPDDIATPSNKSEYSQDKVDGVKKLASLGVSDPSVIAKEVGLSVDDVNKILGS